MKFFNIDLHISVIADLKKIFTELGHEVTDKSLSDHTWVFNRTKDNVKIINGENWRNLNQKMCDDFYEAYKDELSEYDGFIVAYPCTFAMLYEKFNKPIIIVAAIRYEFPFTQSIEKWKWFNNFLTEGIKNKKIFMVANNKADADYAKAFLGTDIDHIPSLCEYTNEYHNPIQSTWLSKSPKIKFNFDGTNIIDSSTLGNHQWKDLYSFSGIVHFPYSISTMSIFEQYTAGVPLLLPTKRFAKKLYFENNILFSELNFNQVLHMPPVGTLMPQYLNLDLNNYTSEQVVDFFLDRADFYDKDFMPSINFFDSFEELIELTNSKIILKNDNRAFRKEYVYNKWKSILEKIYE